jgi:hypothetical protein
MAEAGRKLESAFSNDEQITRRSGAPPHRGSLRAVPDHEPMATAAALPQPDRLRPTTSTVRLPAGRDRRAGSVHLIPPGDAP